MEQKLIVMVLLLLGFCEISTAKFVSRNNIES